MTDVDVTSTKAKAIQNFMLNKINIIAIQAELKQYFNIDFTPLSTFLNSIHRHPGSSNHQGFSGTDLDKKAAEHGVVYPLNKANNNVPNFAGIMAIDSGVCNLAHMEYRLVNGELGKDITYQEGHCHALAINNSTTMSKINTMFIKQEKYKAKGSSLFLDTGTQSYLTNLYKKYNIEPSTHLVTDTHLSKKTYPTNNYFKPDNPFVSDYSKNKKKPDVPHHDPYLTALTRMMTADLKQEYKNQFIDFYNVGEFDENEQQYILTLDDTALINEIMDMKKNIEAEKEAELDEEFSEREKELLLLGVEPSHIEGKNLTELNQLYKFVKGELDGITPE